MILGGVVGVALVVGGAAFFTPSISVVPRAAVTAIPKGTVSGPIAAAGGKLSEPALPTKEEIAALFKLWNDALATGDAGKVADRYAPDAVLLPTMSNQVRRTREEIIDYFRHFLESQPSGAVRESTITVLGPTVAIDTGVYVFSLAGDGGKRQVEARYTFVHELRDGQWLIVNHHSSAMPELPE